MLLHFMAVCSLQRQISAVAWSCSLSIPQRLSPQIDLRYVKQITVPRNEQLEKSVSPKINDDVVMDAFYTLHVWFPNWTIYFREDLQIDLRCWADHNIKRRAFREVCARQGPNGFLKSWLHIVAVRCTQQVYMRKIVFSSLLGPALLDEEPNPFLAKEIRRLRQITYLLALTPVIIATILGCYPIVTGHFYRNALLSLFCTVRLPLNALLRLRPFFI
ncbi:uncharacterized protein [Triticum aestivum]|uniref:uncharacterized protein isoform X2 n=1 Tax=Triticum aestivum TaxID=4565 RepID=UPI001D014CE0|nr:uncharacterized protein LOC123119746 isoform X2 [Triticum aestivum]